MIHAEPISAQHQTEAQDYAVVMRGISKTYGQGDSAVCVLHGIDLMVRSGEFIAIMGPSGSGKTTLMNILGLMDRPTEGSYLLQNREVSTLSAEEQARARSRIFGFIFQRYNLLGTLSALENVEVPATYLGSLPTERHARAQQLLEGFGLGHRMGNRPLQMSGGEQQRVAIARALMNGAPVILADEPTGALDSVNGAELMRRLKLLHAEGRTVILITHDPGVAANAQRIVRIRDGRIESDEINAGFQKMASEHSDLPAPTSPPPSHRRWIPWIDIGESVTIALRSIRANKFRSFLTMLGIIIGVASVVTMLAVGEGAKSQLMTAIMRMGPNNLRIMPGAKWGVWGGLTGDDVNAIRSLPVVEQAVPMLWQAKATRYRDRIYTVSVTGLTPNFLETEGRVMMSGQFFTKEHYDQFEPVAVLGLKVVNELFPDGEDPIGKYILIENSPFQVIGTMSVMGGSNDGKDYEDDVVCIPLSTGRARLYGNATLSQIVAKIDSIEHVDQAQEDIKAAMMRGRIQEDFRIFNQAAMLETARQTQGTFTALLGSIAAISLLVGGIGVMNIMLVNVVERTREIGIRMACGARPKDIQLQFLTEAVVVCGVGGVIGIALGVGAAQFEFLNGLKPEVNVFPVVISFACSFATGIIFGFWPARKASRLDPVVALSSE